MFVASSGYQALLQLITHQKNKCSKTCDHHVHWYVSSCQIYTYHIVIKIRLYDYIHVLIDSLGYFPTIISLETLKFNSEDNECSDHGNSISGHAFYIIWAILTLWYMSQMFKREKVLIATSATNQSQRNRRFFRYLVMCISSLCTISHPI